MSSLASVSCQGLDIPPAPPPADLVQLPPGESQAPNQFPSPLHSLFGFHFPLFPSDASPNLASILGRPLSQSLPSQPHRHDDCQFNFNTASATQPWRHVNLQESGFLISSFTGNSLTQYGPLRASEEIQLLVLRTGFI